ncbi:MAG: hypothetical protein ACJ8HJ_01835 [Massilia sp.]
MPVEQQAVHVASAVGQPFEAVAVWAGGTGTLVEFVAVVMPDRSTLVGMERAMVVLVLAHKIAGGVVESLKCTEIALPQQFQCSVMSFYCADARLQEIKIRTKLDTCY